MGIFFGDAGVNGATFARFAQRRQWIKFPIGHRHIVSYMNSYCIQFKRRVDATAHLMGAGGGFGRLPTRLLSADTAIPELGELAQGLRSPGAAATRGTG